MPSPIMVTPTWQFQSSYPELLHLSVRNPVIFNNIATKRRLTKGSSKPAASSSPRPNNAISSVGCLRKLWRRKEYQKGLHTLLSHQEEKVLYQLTH